MNNLATTTGKTLTLGDKGAMIWRAGRVLMSIKPRAYKDEIGEIKNLIIVCKNLSGEWCIYKAPIEYLEKVLKIIDENDRDLFKLVGDLIEKAQDTQFQRHAALLVNMGMGLLDVTEEPYANQFGESLQEMLVVTKEKVYPVAEAHVKRFLELLNEHDRGLFAVFDRIMKSGEKK